MCNTGHGGAAKIKIISLFNTKRMGSRGMMRTFHVHTIGEAKLGERVRFINAMIVTWFVAKIQ